PSDSSIPLGKAVSSVTAATRAGSNFSRSTRTVLIASRISWVSTAGSRWSDAGRIPDVEEVEPLRRVLADGLLESRDPGAESVLFASRGGGERLRHGHRVAMVGTPHAERGSERDPNGARHEERAEREWRRASEERHEGIAARPQGTVALHRDHLTAPKRRDQLERHGRRRARHEPDAIAVAAHPALERLDLLLRHHDVGGPRRADGE